MGELEASAAPLTHYICLGAVAPLLLSQRPEQVVQVLEALLDAVLQEVLVGDDIVVLGGLDDLLLDEPHRSFRVGSVDVLLGVDVEVAGAAGVVRSQSQQPDRLHCLGVADASPVIDWQGRWPSNRLLSCVPLSPEASEVVHRPLVDRFLRRYGQTTHVAGFTSIRRLALDDDLDARLRALRTEECRVVLVDCARVFGNHCAQPLAARREVLFRGKVGLATG
jgi:hypothetical protein